MHQKVFWLLGFAETTGHIQNIYKKSAMRWSLAWGPSRSRHNHRDPQICDVLLTAPDGSTASHTATWLARFLSVSVLLSESPYSKDKSVTEEDATQFQVPDGTPVPSTSSPTTQNKERGLGAVKGEKCQWVHRQFCPTTIKWGRVQDGARVPFPDPEASPIPPLLFWRVKGQIPAWALGQCLDRGA